MWLLLVMFLVVGLLNAPTMAILTSKAGRRAISSTSSVRSRSVFTVVRFLNVPCSSINGQLTGVCFSLNDCVKLQGIQIGTCASGFGVCCIFRRSCNIVTNQNLTHFTNPGFPEDYSDPGENTCTLTLLRPARTPICQIRLDFPEFDVGRPSEGNCNNDFFRVSGQNFNSALPDLCGMNSGQHAYLNVENTMSPIYLTVNTRGEGRRKWNVRVNYIECSSPSRAPDNCLQYYTGKNGVFSSFNYNPDEPPVRSGGYLNNMNYAICFRKEAGQCSQTYSTRPGEYFMILNLNSDFSPTVEGGAAGLGIAECPDDYLRLGGDRYCGARLNPSNGPTNPSVNSPVTDSTSGPFLAHFVSDGRVTAVGFSLQYSQNPC